MTGALQAREPGRGVTTLLADLTPLATANARALVAASVWGEVDQLEPALCDQIGAELQAALAMQPDRELVMRVCSRLASAYPPRAAEQGGDLTAWLALVVEELAQRPPWAIAAGVPRVWQTVRWRPSVADVLAEVEAEIAPVHAQLRALDRIGRRREEIAAREAEERRRAEEAAERAKERAALAAAAAKGAEAERLWRAESERRWISERDAEAARQLSGQGVKPGDFTAALIALRQRSDWDGTGSLIDLHAGIPKPITAPWPDHMAELILKAARPADDGAP